MSEKEFKNFLKVVGYVATILLVIVVIALSYRVFVINDVQVVPPEPVAEIEVYQLPEYRQATLVDFAMLADDEECNYHPTIIDTRGPSDPTFGIVRKLEPNDYPFVRDQMGIVVDKSGCQNAAPNETYMKAEALELVGGPATLMVNVRDEAGMPMSNILTSLYWPGVTCNNEYTADYHGTCYVAGWTNENGDHGWGFGPGSQCDFPNGGPFDTWVWWGGPIDESDLVRGLCWFDNHYIFRVHWRLTVKQGIEPPPSAEGYEIVDFDEDGQPIGRIPFTTGSAPIGNRTLRLFYQDQELGYMVWETN